MPTSQSRKIRSSLAGQRLRLANGQAQTIDDRHNVVGEIGLDPGDSILRFPDIAYICFATHVLCCHF
jgi:hypothetical protein